MTINRTPLALGLATTLLLGACAPITSYTNAEASRNVTLDTSTTRVDLHFAPGSAQLSPGDAARLRGLAATGAIGAADHVTVAAAGTPYLAEQRIGAVSSVLLHYGIVVTGAQLSNMPQNHALVEVMRTLVTLPPCPNWSKRPQPDYANQSSSNFACSTETNLGLMVANPSDLASARTLGPVAGQPATAAVQRYLADKVTPLPSSATASPFASAAGTATAAAPTTGSQ